MQTLVIIATVVCLAAISVIVLFNALVRSRQVSQEAWSGIDVQLKRRADLVTNLVNTVRGYAAHERDVLNSLVEARNQALAVSQDKIAARSVAEEQLSQALVKIFALAEAYPDLKASANFVELQSALGEIEDELQMARRYYNGAARDLNVRIETFPSNVVAGAFGFAKQAYFQVDNATDRDLPAVSF